MKKVILLVLLFVMTHFSYSQGNMRFGMKIGGNYSTIIETAQRSELIRKSTISPKTSFHGGLTFEFLFSERISLQVEALYSAKGAKLIDKSKTADGTEIVRYLNYMSFPVLGKYYATPELSVELGVEISILSGAKDDEAGIERDILKEVSTNDFGVSGGIAYEFYNGLFIQGRYNLGLLNVKKNSRGQSITNYRHKNGVAQLSIGYIF